MTIPISQALNGAVLARQNAGSLLDAATTLRRAGHIGAAVSLCVLSFEESSKTIALLHRSSGAEHGEFLQAVFSNHATKQALGIEATSTLNKVMSIHYTDHDDPALAPDRVNAQLKLFEAKAELFKQSGFYVDFKEGVWCSPAQLGDDEYQTALFAATINLFVAKNLLRQEISVAD
jgi:AbiV family abortive infection protein